MAEKVHTLSFYGTDGCGKSSIAKAMSNPEGQDYVHIGGSSYHSWLTDDVARMTLGPGHKLNEYSSDEEDSLSLYEDIAVACYGLAERLNSEGKSVLIDSDPYTKRIIWSTVKNGSFDLAYIRKFESKMSDYLGETTAPSHFAAINMNGASLDAQLLKRLQSRHTNSMHDPTEISDMMALSTQVRNVWREIELAKTGLSAIDGFNKRLRDAEIIHVENADCMPENIEAQSASIAYIIKSAIGRDQN